MYFWNIEKLKKTLQKGPLTEAEAFKYLFVTTIAWCMGYIQFGEYNIFDVYFSLILVVLEILGLIYAYKCNGGAKGKNFLQIYISIAWVVSIRWIVLVMIPCLAIYITALVIYSTVPEVTTLQDIIFSSLLLISYFWLLGKHIKDLAK